VEKKVGDPPEWDWFLWGMLAGGVATVAVGAVVLYYTWPILVRILGGEALKIMLEEAERRG
jgi:hypothetical protein